MAIARKILTVVFHMLQRDVDFADLGADITVRRDHVTGAIN
jgi:hypothetical protein